MGNTFWVYFKQIDASTKSEERDYSNILRHIDSIDQLCKELKLDRLSAFHDYADLQDGNDQSSGKNGKWHEISDGLRTVNGLLENHSQLREKLSDEGLYNKVIEELSTLRNILGSKNERKSKFKLGIVT